MKTIQMEPLQKGRLGYKQEKDRKGEAVKMKSDSSLPHACWLSQKGLGYCSTSLQVGGLFGPQLQTQSHIHHISGGSCNEMQVGTQQREGGFCLLTYQVRISTSISVLLWRFNGLFVTCLLLRLAWRDVMSLTVLCAWMCASLVLFSLSETQ